MTDTGTTTKPKQWFVVHTYSGFENKVAQAIESRAKIFGLSEMIGRVVVPTEKVREIRKSKKIEIEQKFFPGYLLVEMDLTDDTWHLVRSTPKVTGFVGSGNKPVPLPPEEGGRSLQHVPLPSGEKSVYQGKNPLADAMAREAITLVGKFLKRAVKDGNDLEARDGMALAATLGGLAFSNSGVALVHAMEYPVGGAVHVSHRFRGRRIAGFAGRKEPPLTRLASFSCFSNATGSRDVPEHAPPLPPP